MAARFIPFVRWLRYNWCKILATKGLAFLILVVANWCVLGEMGRASLTLHATAVVLFFSILSSFFAMATSTVLLGRECWPFLDNYLTDGLHARSHWLNRCPDNLRPGLIVATFLLPYTAFLTIFLSTTTRL